MHSLDIDARHAARSADVAARWEPIIRGLEHSPESAPAIMLADNIDGLLKDSSDNRMLQNWRIASTLLRILALDSSIRAAAKSGAGDVSTDRVRLQVLLHDLAETLADGGDEKLFSQMRSSYDATVPQVNRKAMLAALVKLPLPTLYLAEKRNEWPHAFRSQNDTTVARPPVLRVTAFLDNVPIAANQLLQPHTLHTLSLDVRGTMWPDQAQFLRVELLTTCPSTLFHASVFETSDRSGTTMFESTLSGSIQFDASQSQNASDIVVAIRAAFSMPDGTLLESPVIGHGQLRFRVSSIETTSAVGKPAPPLVASGTLSSSQFETIQKVLQTAFTRDSLRRMLRTKLNVRLDHIAGNGTLIDAIFDVTEWAEQEGRVAELIREAVAFLPQNEDLKRVAAEFERMESCP